MYFNYLRLLTLDHDGYWVINIIEIKTYKLHIAYYTINMYIIYM